MIDDAGWAGGSRTLLPRAASCLRRRSAKGSEVSEARPGFPMFAIEEMVVFGVAWRGDSIGSSARYAGGDSSSSSSACLCIQRGATGTIGKRAWRTWEIAVAPH